MIIADTDVRIDFLAGRDPTVGDARRVPAVGAGRPRRRGALHPPQDRSSPAAAPGNTL